MNYKIVADSSADLLELSGCDFAAVPLKIITDNKEYVDDAALDLDGMIRDLESYKGQSKSSCPNVGDWKSAFGDSDGVFAVTITSGLSGSYNAAKLAMDEYVAEKEGRQGAVLDTLSAGPECTLVVEKLRELISQNLPFAEIEEKIRTYMKKTHLAFSLDSLRNLANNGRVSKAVAKIAGILGIRVIGRASDEGQLEMTDKARGPERALSDLYKNMLARGFNGGRVRIHHCRNLAAAQALEKRIRQDFRSASVTIAGTRALCSFYAEAGGLLVGYEAGGI